MEHIFIPKRFYLFWLLLSGLFLPAIVRAQTPISISGDINVCVGETSTYIPGISNANYTYSWSITPASAGVVLSGNSTGANIQWFVAGGATTHLNVTDPANGNSPVYAGSLSVTVNTLPAPFITTDVLLGCQPLNVDSPRDGPGRPVFDSTHCELVCANSTVIYTANGNSGSTFTWSAPGAVSVNPIGTGQTCSVTWGAPGYGQVSVTETTTAGCQASSSFCVQIVESPVANFKPIPDPGDPIIICLHGELVLQDQSTGSAASPIVSWLWDWGDGAQTTSSPGTVGNPVSHQYDHVGNFSVSLTVTNACGCSSTYKRRVRVIDPPAPVIACPRIVCEGEVTTYTVDQPCSPDSWEVIGGHILGADASKVEVRWDNVDPNTGFGYVSYRSCDPCEMVVTVAVPVLLQHANIQGPPAICLGEQTVYRLPKWPATEFNWYISGPGIIQPTDQRNEIAVTATAPGTITLGLKYNNTVLPCSGSSQITIQVLPPVTINGDSSVCQGGNLSFNIGGPSGSWTLRNPANTVVATGSGASFAYTFPSPGVYRLSVTGTTFCPPEDKFITVVGTPPPPDAILGPDRACAGVPVRYDAGNPVPGTTFLWSTSGGGTLNANIGDHSEITFATVYNNVIVKRVTTDALHCVSSAISKFVDIPVPPLHISGPDTVCHSTQQMYHLDYTDGDEYEWSFSNPNLGSVVDSSNTPNPVVLWNIPSGAGQSVNIIVHVRKCGNNSYTDSFKVFVRGIPTITNLVASSTTICSGDSVTMTVTTNSPVTSATSTTWQWGDGPSITTPGYPASGSFTHTYNTDGATSPAVFMPAITIHDPNGCPGFVSASGPNITVLPRPVAIVSPTGPIQECGSFMDTLFATETTGIGGSNTFSWYPSGTGTSKVVNTYGIYYVTVHNSLYGCSNTSNNVVIEQCDTGGGGGGCGTPPVVTLHADTAECGIITVTASIPGGVTGSWVVPDGVHVISSSNTLLQATADAAGIYTIIYVEHYGSGCAHPNQINVVVPYTAGIRYEVTCNQASGGYNITLYDHSTEFPLTPITTRTFYQTPAVSIGTGSSVTVFQPGNTTRHYYIVVGNSNGLCHSDTVDITTPVFPSANISLVSGTPNPGCVNDVIFNFHRSVSGTDLGYYWTFGDGSSNAGDFDTMGKVYYSPPTSPGVKPVVLRVTDEYGCMAYSNTVNVDVRANPYKGNISAMPNPVCQGNPVTLKYNLSPPATQYPTSYTWYHESVPLFTTPTNTYVVFSSGGYWVQGVGNFGCKVTSDNMISVNVHEVPAVSISGNTHQCVGQSFTLHTQDYGSGYTYSWTGAGSGSGTSLTQTIGSPGPYTYYVTITDNITGCTSTSPAFTVTVSAPPAPPVLSYSVLNCNPYELQLTASGAAGVYNWSNGMLGTTITTPFGGPYEVTLTDNNGCVVQNSFVTPKSPAEYLWVFPTGCFCQELRNPYLIGPIIPFNYWAWLENGGVVSSGGGYMPNYSPLNPGSVYNMTLDNGWCSVTSGDMYYQSDTCERLGGKPAGSDGDVMGMSNLLQDDGGDYNALLVAPNPAGGKTTVTYRFAKGGSERSIELVDMTGRRLQSYRLDNDRGRIDLRLDGYAAGMYQVVMRRNRQVVKQAKLSVTK